MATFTLPEEAHLFRLRLESANIEAFVQDEHAVQMYLLWSNVLGGVRVQVCDDDIGAVEELLATTQPDGGLTGEGPVCPRCGSTAVERERFSRRLAIVSLMVLQFPLLWFRRRCRCSYCLHTWRPEQSSF